MEFTAEQKAAIEVEVKESLKYMGKAMVLVANYAAVNSENKVDDVVVPVLSPIAEASLLDLIGKLKL